MDKNQDIQDFISSMQGEIKDATNVQDCVEEAFRNIAEKFASQGEWDEMDRFFDGVLSTCLDKKKYKQCTTKSIDKFEVEVAEGFDWAKEVIASADPEIEAFYYGYYWDGDEGHHGFIFSCTQTPEEDVDWAANYDKEIPAGEISDYLNLCCFDDDSVDEFTAAIALSYAYIKLFSAVGRVRQRSGVNLPMSYAMYNCEMMYYPQLTS